MWEKEAKKKTKGVQLGGGLGGVLGLDVTGEVGVVEVLFVAVGALVALFLEVDHVVVLAWQTRRGGAGHKRKNDCQQRRVSLLCFGRGGRRC